MRPPQVARMGQLSLSSTHPNVLTAPPAELQTALGAASVSGMLRPKSAAPNDSIHTSAELTARMLPVEIQSRVFDALPPEDRANFYTYFRSDARTRSSDRSAPIEDCVNLLSGAKSQSGAEFMSRDENVRRRLLRYADANATPLIGGPDGRRRAPLAKNIARFLAHEIQRGTFDGEKLADVMMNLVKRLPPLSPHEREYILQACIERLPHVPAEAHDEAYIFFHLDPQVPRSSRLVQKLAPNIPRLRGMRRCDTDHRIAVISHLQQSSELDSAGVNALFKTFQAVQASSRKAKRNHGVGSLMAQTTALRFQRDTRVHSADTHVFLTNTLGIFRADMQRTILAHYLHNVVGPNVAPLAR